MARDLCLIEYRRRALRDRRLSHAAKVLVCQMVEELYLDRSWSVTEELPLTWKKVSIYMQGLCRRQSQRLLAELETHGYLKLSAYKKSLGSTCSKWFFIVIKGDKNDALKGVKNGSPKGVKNGSRHISSSFGRDLIEEAAPLEGGGGRVETAASPEETKATGPIRPEKALAALASLRAELSGGGE